MTTSLTRTPSRVEVLNRTPFGPVVIVWQDRRTGPTVTRILLSRPDCTALQALQLGFPEAVRSSCPLVIRLGEQIQAFLSGEPIVFSLKIVDLAATSEFQRKVLTAEHRVPRGRVTTYQRLAGYIGQPSAARAVGRALATNPFPLVIPCHRALRSDGTLGGFMGGVGMKRSLLELEGVHFDSDGRVVQPDLL